MIAQFRFGFGTPALTEEQVAHLRRLITDLRLDDDGKPVSFYIYTADIEKVYAAIPDAKLELESLLGHDIPKTLVETIQRLERFADKFADRAYDNEATYNAKVNVHVPGLGLLAINEVTWEEDCCTKKLQERLEDGWRIIAACPQPDQRRPDYVLGRTKGE